jgi:hypothetical protein
MLTPDQSKLFGKIVDLNWDISHSGASFPERLEMVREMNRIEQDLRDSMGEEEYDRFLDLGRRMFAPADEDEE